MAQRTNEQWLTALRASGSEFEEALADLRQILKSGLQRGLLGRVKTNAPEFDTQADDFVQEALLKIVDKLDTFAGRSKFTTWAHKVAVSVALTELRRKRWQDSSLDGIMETEQGEFTPAFVADPSPSPEMETVRAEMVQKVRRILDEGLTKKQRTALIASVIQGRSTKEVAALMDMKPNAVYKLIHDARVRLKSLLREEGLLPQDVLAVFD